MYMCHTSGLAVDEPPLSSIETFVVQSVRSPPQWLVISVFCHVKPFLEHCMKSLKFHTSQLYSLGTYGFEYSRPFH